MGKSRIDLAIKSMLFHIYPCNSIHGLLFVQKIRFLYFMALFLSSHVNRLDQKGRVSVPSAFRAQLEGEDFKGVVLFKSSAHQCLEGFTWSYMRSISDRLDDFNLFSSEQDDLATSIFGNAVQLPIDGNGRIILPAELIEFVGLTESASFVGMGTKFQIWCPERFADRQENARKAVQKEGLTIPNKRGGKAE